MCTGSKGEGGWKMDMSLSYGGCQIICDVIGVDCLFCEHSYVALAEGKR